MAWRRPKVGGGFCGPQNQRIDESLPMVLSGEVHFPDFGPYLEGPKTMPWHGTGNNDASAAAGARFGTRGSVETRP
eukprot:9402679-Pyramimonas_sp.AAC.1